MTTKAAAWYQVGPSLEALCFDHAPGYQLVKVLAEGESPSCMQCADKLGIRPDIVSSEKEV